MQQYLKIVGNGRRTARDLTGKEAEAAFTLIIEKRASLPQVAAFMAGLRFKEESPEELAIFARGLRCNCQTIQRTIPHLVDICVPYDGRCRQMSLIPAAALIAASTGAKVGLHGRCGQSTSPKFGIGTGDILSALDIAVNLPLAAANELLMDETLAVSYVDVSQFAPALEYFNTVRLDFGMRSFFNTIEKLINPFGALNAIVGVFHGNVLERVAYAMQSQGYQKGLVVQGTEGAIDVLPNRRTPLIEFQSASTLHSWTINPANHGGWLDYVSEQPVTPQTNAILTQQILNPQTHLPELNAYRQGALLTAALMVYAAGKTATYTEAVEHVQIALESGDAAARLTRWQQRSGQFSNSQRVSHVC